MITVKIKRIGPEEMEHGGWKGWGYSVDYNPSVNYPDKRIVMYQGRITDYGDHFVSEERFALGNQWRVIGTDSEKKTSDNKMIRRAKKFARKTIESLTPELVDLTKESKEKK